MSKRLGGNICCKDKISSWYLIGFPEGSIIGSTVCVGERNPPLYCTLTLIAMHRLKTETKDTMSLDWVQLNFVTLGLGSDGCQHEYITISSAIKQLTDFFCVRTTR
ncbi:unnamed protein product [Ascophyllum nodosum]